MRHRQGLAAVDRWHGPHLDEGSHGADEDTGMEHHVQLCAAVDEVMRAHEMCVWHEWLSNGMYVCRSCIKVNGVLEGGPTGQGRGGPTCIKQHQNSLQWSPV